MRVGARDPPGATTVWEFLESDRVMDKDQE